MKGLKYAVAGADYDEFMPVFSAANVAPSSTNAAANGTDEETPYENAPLLKMVHSCLVNTSVFLPRYNDKYLGDYINMRTMLYRYGGQVKRVKSTNGSIFDVILCDRSVCDFCRGAPRFNKYQHDMRHEYAERAKHDKHIPLEQSPTEGLSFAHLWHDSKRMPEPNPEERWIFEPKERNRATGTAEPTWSSQVVFDDSEGGILLGIRGFGKVALCDPFTCYLCKVDVD